MAKNVGLCVNILKKTTTAALRLNLVERFSRFSDFIQGEKEIMKKKNVQQDLPILSPKFLHTASVGYCAE